MCSASTLALGVGELYSHRANKVTASYSAEGPAARPGAGYAGMESCVRSASGTLEAGVSVARGTGHPRFPARSRREAAVMAEALWSTDTGEAVYRSRDPVRNLRLR